MKGIISGIKRMEIHDGEGIRTTVFFKGCPLKCIWCHNPESVSPKKQLAFYENKCMDCELCASVCPNQGTVKEVLFSKGCIGCFECEKICPLGAVTLYGKEYTIDELVNEVMQDKPFFQESNGGITLSGGECLSQADFAVEFAKKLFEKGISVYVDTCGYAPRDVFERIIPYTDKFLYDIKAVDGTLHKTLTGRDNKIILANLEFLVQSGSDIEIRYPYVKGYNDGQYPEIAELIKKLNIKAKVKVLKYHSLSRTRYLALGTEDTMPYTDCTDAEVEYVSNLINKKPAL